MSIYTQLDSDLTAIIFNTFNSVPYNPRHLPSLINEVIIGTDFVEIIGVPQEGILKGYWRRCTSELYWPVLKEWSRV